MAQLKDYSAENYPNVTEADLEKTIWFKEGRLKPDTYQITLEKSINLDECKVSLSAKKKVKLHTGDVLNFKSGFIILDQDVEFKPNQPLDVVILPAQFKINQNEIAQTYAMTPLICNFEIDEGMRTKRYATAQTRSGPVRKPIRVGHFEINFKSSLKEMIYIWSDLTYENLIDKEIYIELRPYLYGYQAIKQLKPEDYIKEIIFKQGSFIGIVHNSYIEAAAGQPEPYKLLPPVEIDKI